MTRALILILVTIGAVLLNNAKAQELSYADKKEIKIQALDLIEDLKDKLNTISNRNTSDSDTRDIINQSFNVQNSRRIFYNEKIIIEDNTDPSSDNKKHQDYSIKTYLENFDLVYNKSLNPTISYTDIEIGNVRTKEFTYVYVYYSSHFQESHREIKTSYKSRRRVATIIANKVEGRWESFIYQVVFSNDELEALLHQDKIDSDGDGIRNDDDECPDEYGLKNLFGCPDSDGDGLADIHDNCPTEPGIIENMGCPEFKDSDGDGLADSIDDCPYEAGPESNNGCPVKVVQDIDKDGVNDEIDNCPNSFGPKCNYGCPVITNKPPIVDSERVLWYDLVGDFGMDEAQDIIRNKEGEILFVGSSENDLMGKDLYLGKLDPCNQTLSELLKLGNKGEDLGRKIIQTSSGDYVIVGFSQSAVTNSRDAWLIRTDGKQVSEQFFGAEGEDEFFDVLEDRNGSLIMTGSKSGKLWVLKTTRAGKIIQEIIYDDYSSSRGNTLIASKSGEVFITGYVKTKADKNLVLLKVVNTTQKLEKLYEKKQAEGYKMILDTKGNLVITGVEKSKHFREDILVLKLDMTGKLLWEKSFGGIGIDVGRCIIETIDGDYLITGYSSSYSEGARRSKLWMNLLHETGNSKWEEPIYFGSQQTDRAYSVVQTQRDHVTIAGYTESSFPGKKTKKRDIWLVNFKL